MYSACFMILATGIGEMDIQPIWKRYRFMTESGYEDSAASVLPTLFLIKTVKTTVAWKRVRLFNNISIILPIRITIN